MSLPTPFSSSPHSSLGTGEGWSGEFLPSAMRPGVNPQHHVNLVWEHLGIRVGKDREFKGVLNFTSSRPAWDTQYLVLGRGKRETEVDYPVSHS